jgi:UDP-N-acetylglucosamine--N-acetylmuramyl-(pentapeptide) pyrophosphoryl-undecaprenol N-acetylglucosamine transferase
MSEQSNKPNIVIACGGTGGICFPDLAVAQQFTPPQLHRHPHRLKKGGGSAGPSECPGHGNRYVAGRGSGWEKLLSGFASAFVEIASSPPKDFFKAKPPQAVLAMGGFTSLAPILAGKFAGAPISTPSPMPFRDAPTAGFRIMSTAVFVGFSHAAPLFTGCDVTDIGMPVRAQFTPAAIRSRRSPALGLDPTRSTLLIMGGSQGATAINDLLIQSLPHLVKLLPEFQFLHITGDKDEGACPASL